MNYYMLEKIFPSAKKEKGAFDTAEATAQHHESLSNLLDEHQDDLEDADPKTRRRIIGFIINAVIATEIVFGAITGKDALAKLTDERPEIDPAHIEYSDTSLEQQLLKMQDTRPEHAGETLFSENLSMDRTLFQDGEFHGPEVITPSGDMPESGSTIICWGESSDFQSSDSQGKETVRIQRHNEIAQLEEDLNVEPQGNPIQMEGIGQTPSQARAEAIREVVSFLEIEVESSAIDSITTGPGGAEKHEAEQRAASSHEGAIYEYHQISIEEMEMEGTKYFSAIVEVQPGVITN